MQRWFTIRNRGVGNQTQVKMNADQGKYEVLRNK